MIHFVSVCNINETIFNPFLKGGLKFESESPRICISISPGSEDGAFQNLECKVRYSLPATEREADFVVALNAGRYLAISGAPLSLPFKSGNSSIDEDGCMSKGFPVSREMLPASIQLICERAASEMNCQLIRFMKLLRWRQDLDGPALPFDREPVLYWKVSEDVYHYVPSKSQSFSSRGRIGIRWGDDDVENFSDIWSTDGVVEPLAHELLREARSLLGAADRSALLIGFSALESGVKQHIAQMLPDASWLVFEVPAPPISKMLAKFIPMLHKNNSDVSDWSSLKKLFGICQQMLEDRNRLAHTGQMPDRASIAEYLDAVHDVLYFLDVLSGNSWAKGLVFPETRSALGWPAGDVPRWSVHFSSGIVP